jgi:hypothetical protein
MIAKGNTLSMANGTYYAGSIFTSVISFPATMRTAPSLYVANGTDYFVIYSNGVSDNFDTITSVNQPTTTNTAFDVTSLVSGTAGNAGRITTNNASAYFGVSAEL